MRIGIQIVVLSSLAGLIGGCGCGGFPDRLSVVDGDPMVYWEGQEDPRWCWAACLQMRGAILAEEDVPTQEEYVEAYKHRLSAYLPGNDGVQLIRATMDEAQKIMQTEVDFDDAAASWEIREALAPGHLEWTQERGVVVIEQADLVGPRIDEDDLLCSLKNGEPVVVSLTEAGEFSRHAYLLVSATLDEGEVISFGLMDPLYEDALVVISAEEYRDRVRGEINSNTAAAFQSDQRKWISEQKLADGVYVRNPIDPGFEGFLGGLFRMFASEGAKQPIYERRVDSVPVLADVEQLGG